MDLKVVLRIAFFIIIIFIGYLALRDSWGDIWSEIKVTSPVVLVKLMILSGLFCVFEGLALANIFREINPKFTYMNGIGSAAYMSFFRVVTFGSGTVASSVYYNNKKGISAEGGFAGYTVNYMIQRLCVVGFFVVSYIINYNDVKTIFVDYQGYMIAGFFVTLLIAGSLLLVCLSSKAHDVILLICRKADRKKRHDIQIIGLEGRMTNMRKETTQLLRHKMVLLRVIIFNLLKLSCWFVMPAVIFGVGTLEQVRIYTSITSIMFALTGVIPVPGGAGATEFLFATFFTPLVGNISAVSGAFIYRMASFYLPVVWGGIAYIRLNTIEIKQDIKKHHKQRKDVDTKE